LSVSQKCCSPRMSREGRRAKAIYLRCKGFWEVWVSNSSSRSATKGCARKWDNAFEVSYDLV
jgi:hypothetical protein